MLSYNIRALFIFLFSGFGTIAQNSSTVLLDSFYNKQDRPVIMLNYTSTDCVNCRLGVSSLLPKLAGILGSSHMGILIDHKNQLMYLKKFPDVFSQFKVTVSKELSDSLSPDGRSKIFVIGKDQIIPYGLNVSSDSLVNDIVASFNRFGAEGAKAVVTRHHEYTGTDTVFEPSESIFEASAQSAVLFSKKFQVGKITDLTTGSNRDFEFAANATAINKLNKILSTHYPRGAYVSPDSAIKILNMMTLPAVYVENIRIVSGKCYVAFRYNSVTIDGGPMDDPDIGIRPRYFIGLLDMDKPGSDIADLSQCRQFFLMDTTHVKDQVYSSDFRACMDIRGNQFVFSSSKVNNEVTPKMSDTTLYISSFDASKGNRPQWNALYRFAQANPNDQLVLRYNNIGQPVIWNQTTMEFSNNNELLVDKKQMHDIGLTFVYDFISMQDSLYILGVIDYKRMALLKCNIKTKVILVSAHINYSPVYNELRFIDGNEFAGYVKDEQKNTFTIAIYNWAAPEKP